MRATMDFFAAERGFGFATLEDGSACFVGSRQVDAAGIADLSEGDVVEVATRLQADGRQAAMTIEMIQRAPRRHSRRLSSTGGAW
jgi:cold shock CspA family protein